MQFKWQNLSLTHKVAITSYNMFSEQHSYRGYLLFSPSPLSDKGDRPKSRKTSIYWKNYDNR